MDRKYSTNLFSFKFIKETQNGVFWNICSLEMQIHDIFAKLVIVNAYKTQLTSLSITPHPLRQHFLIFYFSQCYRNLLAYYNVHFEKRKEEETLNNQEIVHGFHFRLKNPINKLNQLGVCRQCIISIKHNYPSYSI